MTKSMLLFFLAFAMSQPQTAAVQITTGKIRTEHETVVLKGVPTRAELRVTQLSIVFSDGKTARGEVIMIREPKSHSFWWQYQAVESEQPSNHPLKDYIVYLDGEKAYGFSFSRPFLWVRESIDHFSTMDEGQASVLSEVRNKAAKIESQTVVWAHPVNVGVALGGDFLALRGSASPAPGPRLRKVSKTVGNWHLIFDGPNKDSAEVVLSDDYRVTGTTHFPPKIVPNEPEK